MYSMVCLKLIRYFHGIYRLNGPNRNKGIRNNCVRALVNLPDLPVGKHKLFIRAVDPGVVIDRIGFVTGSR